MSEPVSLNLASTSRFQIVGIIWSKSGIFKISGKSCPVRSLNMRISFSNLSIAAGMSDMFLHMVWCMRSFILSNVYISPIGLKRTFNNLHASNPWLGQVSTTLSALDVQTSISMSWSARLAFAPSAQFHPRITLSSTGTLDFSDHSRASRNPSFLAFTYALTFFAQGLNISFVAPEKFVGDIVFMSTNMRFFPDSWATRAVLAANNCACKLSA